MPSSKDTFFDGKLLERLAKRDMLPSGVPEVEFLETGIFSLDRALGGGLARKRITEIAGKNQTAKSLTALLIAQHTIMRGGRVAWFEAEESLDPYWVVKMGIPEDEVYWGEEDSLTDTHFHIFHPAYLERGFETIRDIAQTGLYDLIVYDSVGGSPTLAAYEANIEDQQMTQTARVCSRFRAVMPQDIKKGNSAVLLTNTVMQAINLKFINPLLPYGGTLIPSGGEGIAFLSTARIFMYDAKKVEAKVNGKDMLVGKEHGGRIYKNKVAGAPKDFHFRLVFEPDYFIDIPQDIADTGRDLGVLDQRGRFWFYKDQNIAGSEAAFKELITSDIDLLNNIEADIRQAITATRQTKDKAVEEEPEYSGLKIGGTEVESSE